MRLINCATGKLETVRDWPRGQRPPYAILSHTWTQHHEPEEVSYKDYLSGRPATKEMNWAKVDNAIGITKADPQRLNYLWIDTCCIDKDSSTELSESINSMFKWYSEAAVCYVHLADFVAQEKAAADKDTDDCSSEAVPGSSGAVLASRLGRSRWFYRGWTLQELVAPRVVKFFDRGWQYFGSRQDLRFELDFITGIGEDVLADPTHPRLTRDVQSILRGLPLARKMSWAATRKTTREEDTAYSLLGIFGVSMPLLYGEGHRAFLRLQEEIMKARNDLSLFAWESVHGEKPRMRGVLAESPREFANCGNIVLSRQRNYDPEFSLSNKGLRITAPLRTFGESDPIFLELGCFKATKDGKKWCSIQLMQIVTGQYVRISFRDDVVPGRGASIPASQLYITTTVEQLEDAILASRVGQGHAFRFVLINQNYFARIGVSYSAAWDVAAWDEEAEAFITKDHAPFAGYVRFQTQGPPGASPRRFSVACGVDPLQRLWVQVARHESQFYDPENTYDLYHLMKENASTESCLRVELHDEDERPLGQVLEIRAAISDSSCVTLNGMQNFQITVRAVLLDSPAGSGHFRRHVKKYFTSWGRPRHSITPHTSAPAAGKSESTEYSS